MTDAYDSTSKEVFTLEGYVFVLSHGSKIFEVYCREIKPDNLCDRYMGRSPKDTKTAFENIRKFQPIPLPSGLKSYCDCTKKPCDPESWFCHRQFVAIRYLKGHPGTNTLNKGCKDLRTNNSKETKKAEP